MNEIISYRVLLSVMLMANYLNALTPELTSVSELDIDRYVGKWHEIARLPMKHQDGCMSSQAEYSKDKNGYIQVVNSCTLKDGSRKEARGIARIEDKKTNSKLKVNFVPACLRWIGIGWADYWVIELDSNYQFAVVSEPKRKFLWILSRTPQMEKSTYESIIGRLKSNGFDLSQLIVSGIES